MDDPTIVHDNTMRSKVGPVAELTRVFPMADHPASITSAPRAISSRTRRAKAKQMKILLWR